MSAKCGKCELQPVIRCPKCAGEWCDAHGAYHDPFNGCRLGDPPKPDPEFDKMMAEWVAENAAKRRADAMEEHRQYGVSLDIALRVRGEMP